jgi:hypothetical protein
MLLGKKKKATVSKVYTVKKWNVKEEDIGESCRIWTGS